MQKTIKKKYAYMIIGFGIGILAGLLLGGFFVGNLNKGAEKNVTKEKENKSSDDVYKIESLYCDLYYPTEWKEKVIVEEELNAVHFVADLGENKVIDLFDVIILEMDEENDENHLEAHFVMFEAEFDEQWSDKDKQIITEMQEDACVVADYLEKEEIKVVR